MVVDAGDSTARATVAAVDEGRQALTLDAPLSGRAELGSRVALGDVATVVAVFDSRVGLRRFPRVDSRTYAHAPAGMTKPVMGFGADWVKIEIERPIEGWVSEASSRIVHAGIVDEVAFSTRTPVRSLPYADEALVVWEGRIEAKTSETDDDGQTDYALQATDVDGDERVFHLTQQAWNSFRETDYIVDRQGLGVAQADIPIGFTKLGPPYEVLARDGERLLIQWQDQGWVRTDSCRLEVRYNYSTSRRQDLAQALREQLSRVVGWAR